VAFLTVPFFFFFQKIFKKRIAERGLTNWKKIYIIEYNISFELTGKISRRAKQKQSMPMKE